MTDLPSSSSVDPSLRAYLDAELDRAERDFPHIRRQAQQPVARRLPAGIALAIVAVVAAIVVGPRLLPATPAGPGEIQIASDGLPVSIDGEPVLRGDQITARIASSGPFLAGGMLELGSDPCPDTAVPSAAPCVERWKLVGASGAGPQFALDGMPAAPGFVRTSGALTVVHVTSSGQRLCTTCEATLTVETVAWRKPTKGPIPDNASPPQGGPVYPALVPDFVPALARDGTTIAGYVPKAYLIESGGVLPGTPSNPPQASPDPVYAEDLTTLVGHMVPGVGFVPLGSSVPSAGPPESVAPASVAPSASAAPAVDCGRLAVAACEQAIALARSGHESELATTSRIVADDSCAPSPVICDRLYPFDSIVVFVTAGADTTGWYAFHVTGLEYSVPTKAEPWQSDLPAHIIQRLNAPASPDPSGG